MNYLFETKPVWQAHSKVLERLRLNEESFRYDIEEAGFSKARDEQAEAI